MPRVLSALLLLGVCGLAAAVGRGVAAEADRLRFVTAIYLDGKGVGMRQPEGVACNDKSTLVVADTGRGRLLRYSLEAAAVKPAGEIVAPQVPAPIRLQLTSRDDVLVLDGKQRRIARLGAGGDFKGYVTPEGVPEPSTVVPRSFKVDRGDLLYVLDVFSARVLVLDAGGKYQRHVPFPAPAGFFSDLAVDARGTIFLVDSVRAEVWSAAKGAAQFTPLARLREHAAFPASIAVDARGVLFVVDQNGGGIVLVAQDGAVLGRQLAMGWTDGFVYYPAQICLTDKGQVIVADRGNSRVQVFALTR